MSKTNYKSLPYTPSNFLGESKDFKFKSWADFQLNLKLRQEKGISFSSEDSSKQRKSSDFNDTDSIEEATQKLTQKVEPTKTKKKELFEVQKKASKMFLSDTPFDAIDIPTFLGGSQDYWTGFTSSKRRSQKKVVKTIFLCVNALSGVSTEELSDYLAKSLVGIFNNYSFNNLVITACNDDSSNVSQFYINISYREVMLIFRVGFADFFRRVIFFFMEQYSELSCGYGRTLTATEVKELQDYEDCEVFSYYK
jgi:hypothetical protein